MNNRLDRLIAATVLACIGSASAAAAQPASPPVDVPPALAVPAGHVAFLTTHAVGTQNYVCLPAGSGVAWKFQAPQATLFQVVGKGAQQIATHFLSANPEENLARPTWQHSFDTSRVWGRVIASSNDPVYVEPGAVPWLLLEAAGTDAGFLGHAVLAQTTFIQRVKTAGGMAPSAGCSQSTDVGALALVPYETDYTFYKATQPD